MSLLAKIQPNTLTSLDKAFNNLLDSFDFDEITAPLDAELEWEAIESHNSDIQVLQYGDVGTWPSTNNAIIKFKEYPHHYAKVHNFQEHEILDDDGKAKKAYIYGVPQGWASYGCLSEIASKPAPDDRLYTLKERETLWSVARDHKISAEELAEHNGIEKADMYNVSEGYVLHFPTSKERKEKPTTQYMVYPEPVLRHISKDGRTHKYSFGNAKNIEDIKPVGTSQPQGFEVRIVAEAHVPVLDNGEAKILRFDMDANAFNVELNKPISTIGYNWTHLSDGVVPPSEQPVQDPPKAPEEEEEQEVAKIPEEVKEKVPWSAQYEYTYTPFQDGAVVHIARKNMRVRSISSVDTQDVYKDGERTFTGTYSIDGLRYFRSTETDETGILWAYPFNKFVEKIVESEEDKMLYTVNEKPLKLNFHFGRLTAGEKLVAEPLVRVETYGTKAIRFIKQKTRRK